MTTSVRISVSIALILVILAIVSAIVGAVTKQHELFTCISLVCSYTGLLAALIGWILLIRMWDKEDKKWEQEEHNTDTTETVECGSYKITF